MKPTRNAKRQTVIVEFKYANVSQIHMALRSQPKGTRFTGKLTGKILAPVFVRVR